MKESNLVKSLRMWLNKQPNTVCWKIHGSQFQESGIPDLIGVSKGIFFSVETKVKKNVLSPVQIYQNNRIKNAMGLCFVVDENNIIKFKENFNGFIREKLKAV